MGFSLVAASRGYYSLASVHGFLITVASLAAEHRLRGRTGSVVVAHGLSCPTTCGISPDQKANPSSLHWQGGS